MIELLVASVFSGLLSSLSPCSLPIYPVMLNSLCRSGSNRRVVALSFTLGIVSAFMLFYLLIVFLTSLLGDLAYDVLGIFTDVVYAGAALLCFLFALRSLGVLNVNMRTYSPFKPSSHGGVVGSFLTGMMFSTIVTPCSLPFMITGIMPVLLMKETFVQGFFLMLAFSLSMGVPILSLGLASDAAFRYMGFFRDRMNDVERVSAVFLIVAGLYFSYLLLI
ncbi:MAG: cytochrome c biogenesis protein CcdA [Candidatus Altiarchaeota archaeon]